VRPNIHVSAALIVDDAGRLLVVRKRGTHVYMQPGGKPEPGETAAETLSRELAEELGVDVPVDELEPLGQFTAPAANEASTNVVADVFRVTITAPVAAGAEIDDVRWMHPSEFATSRVAPLITEHMLPFMSRTA
jgi:8-oxo-dGTP diphosphatase